MATVEVEDRELIKSISWFDGFVVAMANPAFLLTSLGGSALALGGWGAVIVWAITVVIGSLHNYIYSELSTMFPNLSGGIAIYAHEAWKRYLSFVGPVAAFGYWIGWSVVLSATGVIVGFLVQGQWYPSSESASSAWNHSGHFLGIPLYTSFPIALTVVIIFGIWIFNILGMRPSISVVRLRHRGVTPNSVGSFYVPAVPHRRFSLVEPPQQHSSHCGGHRVNGYPACARVDVRDVLVLVRV